MPLRTLIISTALLMNGCIHLVRTAPVLPEPDPVAMGTILVDAGRREVIATGFVNQAEGLVELLACGPGGKVHESIFVLHADPKDIQAGLLLIGLRPGDRPAAGLGQGPPLGEALIIEAAWDENGIGKRVAAEQLIYDYKTRKPARHGGWIFNGSMFKDGSFMADAEESMVATHWDPWAIVNIGRLGDDDDRLGVNRALIPPRFTPVRLIFRALP